jgi:hypothetical protein
MSETRLKTPPPATEPARRKAAIARLVAEMTYLRHGSPPPKTAPAGQMLVHNVRPTSPNQRTGANGFRAWLSPRGTAGYVVCDCGWAPGVTRHYRPYWWNRATVRAASAGAKDRAAKTRRTR